LVPQRDPVAIAEAVGQLLDEPALRQRLGTAGRERAIALLSQSRIAEAYGDLIEDMLPARDRLAA
jgi:glycosyltransferase involved in cell wall biosynthesis